MSMNCTVLFNRELCLLQHMAWRMTCFWPVTRLVALDDALQDLWHRRLLNMYYLPLKEPLVPLNFLVVWQQLQESQTNMGAK